MSLIYGSSQDESRIYHATCWMQNLASNIGGRGGGGYSLTEGTDKCQKLSVENYIGLIRKSHRMCEAESIKVFASVFYPYMILFKLSVS